MHIRISHTARRLCVVYSGSRACTGRAPAAFAAAAAPQERRIASSLFARHMALASERARSSLC